MPKFRDMSSWQQAEQLMQPAFIRLIDNVRKQLDESTWTGSYEEIPVWSEGTSDAEKAQVVQLQERLKTAPAEEADEIERSLAQLPTPYPGYHLTLKQHDRQVSVDLWQLCYQICFQNYDADSGTAHASGQTETLPVEVDTSLFDETGEVDWNRLDEKTQQIVERIFAALPGGSNSTIAPE